MNSPVRTQTDMVRKAFKDAGYDLKHNPEHPGRPYLESCHSSRVDVRGVPCVETFVVTTGGLHFWKAPAVILDEVARVGLATWQHGDMDTMLKALGRLSYPQLVARIEESKFSVTLPLPDARLPEQLWEPTDTRIVEAKYATIRVAEAMAGWTITAEHKARRQPFRMRVRRCGCAEARGWKPVMCRCVLKLKPLAYFGDPAKHDSGPRVCHHRGHVKAVDAFVDFLAGTYA